MTRLRLLIILLAAVLLHGCATADRSSLLHAQEPEGTLQKVKRTGVLTIGYLESAPPFSFPGPDKRPVGYSIELCLHVASGIEKQLGIERLKIGWVPVTVENRIDLVAEGKVDLECSTTTATLSRQERVDFSLMTFVDGGGLLTTSDSNLRAVTELGGKRIAVITGSTTEKALTGFLEKEFITADIVRVKNHLEGLTSLENGAVDAFASDRGILIGLVITSKDPTRFAIAGVVLSYEPYGFMLRRNDSAFRLAVNRALAALYRSGDVVDIYDHWFGALGKPGPAIQAMYLLNGYPE